jgi:hypothetical protein
MDWIRLAEDSDQWRAFVKKVMILRVPQNNKNTNLGLKMVYDN